MKTRSKPKASLKAEVVEGISTRKTLSQLDANPPRVVVLPKDISSDARIVTLKNPATSIPSRYFYCPNVGLHEFTKITTEKKAPRSWLLSRRSQTDERNTSSKGDNGRADVDDLDTVGNGYILKEPDMLIATPYDPLFLILPILLPASASSGTKQMFLALDEHLDSLGATAKDMKHLLSTSEFGSVIEKRMDTICDAVDAGDEKMYRISQDKLVRELLFKAKRMCANGLSASMEEHFVKDALKAPVLDLGAQMMSAENKIASSQPLELSTSTNEESQSSTPSLSGASSNMESQSSTSTEATSVSSNPVAEDATTEYVEVKSSDEPPQEIVQLLRVRTALSFLLSTCVPEHIRKIINGALSEAKLINFTPLDAHLAHIASLRQQAQVLRNVSDNINRKRTIEDEEAAEVRAEKKRKKEEEEKKKKSESRALKDLKKADTSGMKKLSSFFTKAAAK